MTVYLCGDSISASYREDLAPLTGWGQLLEKYLGSVRVENRALAGRSAKSFLYEGRLQKIEEELSKDDLLLVQFTHNDENPLVWRYAAPRLGFPAALRLYADTARRWGAVPVFLTPVCMRVFENGELRHTHGDYPKAVRTLAKDMNVPLLDMYRFSFETVREMGEEGSKSFFLHTGKGEYPAYPDGKADNAHLCLKGAELLAGWAAKELISQGLIPGGDTP